MILVSIHMSVQNGPTNLVFNLKLSINYPWLPWYFLFHWGGTRPLFDISSHDMFSLSTKVWNKRSNGTLIAAGRDFEFWGKLGYLSWNFKFESIVIDLHHYTMLPWWNFILIHESIASSILHLISNSRIFSVISYLWVVSTWISSHQVLTRKSRDFKKIWAIWMQTGGKTCGKTAAVLTPGFAILAPKKKRESSQDVFFFPLLPVLVQPFFFRCTSHISVKWCLIISYVVSQPEVSVKKDKSIYCVHQYVLHHESCVINMFVNSIHILYLHLYVCIYVYIYTSSFQFWCTLDTQRQNHPCLSWFIRWRECLAIQVGCQSGVSWRINSLCLCWLKDEAKVICFKDVKMGL